MYGNIVIQSDYEIFPWDIGKFIETTSLNYIKLLYITKICDLYSKNEITDNMIYIEKNNFYQNKKELLIHRDPISKIFLLGKSSSPEDFWYILRKNSRPLVFIKVNDQFKPLFLEKDNELVFTRLSVESPPEFVIKGFLPALIDLFFAKRRESREIDAHINSQIGQVARNIEDIVRAAQIINDPRTPEGVRAYAKSILDDIMYKQSNLNEKMSINVKRIDRKT